MKLVSTLVAGLATASAEPITIKLEGRAQKPSPVNVKLTNWWNVTDYQWYGKVSVGTPPQEFNVLFDTGSTDLLLPKKGCTSCSDHNTFDPSKSSSYSKQPNIDFTASYGTAGNAEPLSKPASMDTKIVTDTVTIGDVSVGNQTFILADDYPKELGQNPLGPNIDGIFGLGPPGASVLSQATNKTFTTTFWNLVESEQLPEPVFSLYLNSGNGSPSGEATLGGIDSSRYEGDLTKVPFNETITGMVGEWFIDHPAFYVNKEPVKNSATNKPFPGSLALLDSGTAYIQAPDHQTAKDIYASISPEIKLLDKLGVWGAPCDVMNKLQPELTFTVGAGDKLVNLTMPKDAFNLGEHPAHPGQCQTVILHSPEPISELATIWIIGSPVLKGYYTVWDGKNLELGVGKLKGSATNGSSAGTTSPSSTPTTAGAGVLTPCWGALALVAGFLLF
ncbi:hypothetical protein FDECE_712 [Fusarium decemcellulare]|nr:hypothetical protein FDECE_712 [Fusarium decemcellulare]